MHAPLGVQILSISCSFWEILVKSYVGTPPSGDLAPPPRGNPGTATADNFSLIDHMTTYLKWLALNPGENDYIAFDEYNNEQSGRSFGNCEIPFVTS